MAFLFRLVDEARSRPIALSIRPDLTELISLFRTDGRESPILAESDADGHSDKPRSKYGELVILG
jgi:hypothetical protein